MRFALSSDQADLRDAARDLLGDLCTPEVVRQAVGGAYDPKPWAALAEMGVLAVLTPEAAGGLGLDETYLVPVITEAGRVALPQPFTTTALLAAPLGVTAALEEGAMVSTDLGGPLVPAADSAEVFLLAAADELRRYESDDLEIAAVDTVDKSRHCGRVRPRGNGELVSDDPAVLQLSFDRGVLGTAAELLGLAETMLALTVEYVTQRQQFGRPIGSFQAVKHHLADARLQIEFAAPAVTYAAAVVARCRPELGHPEVGQPEVGRLEVQRAVSMAKWLAGEAAGTTGRVALQCHGAIGYTVETDLQLFLKRSWALARSWGDRDFHADRVANSLLG